MAGDGGHQRGEVVDGGLVGQDLFVTLEQPGHVDVDDRSHRSGDPPLAPGVRFVLGEGGRELVGVRGEEPAERLGALLQGTVPGDVGRGCLATSAFIDVPRSLAICRRSSSSRSLNSTFRAGMGPRYRAGTHP
ncbi:hypothetical protein SALBM311S_11600 [Streptomyces alboniger]